MGVDVIASLVGAEPAGLRVAGGGAGDQHVVDGSGQRGEEPSQPAGVGDVEGGDAGRELEAGPVQAVGITRDQYQVCPVSAGQAGRLEPDAGAASDHHDGLPA